MENERARLQKNRLKLTFPVTDGFGRFFSRGEDALDDRSVELIFALRDSAGVVFDVQDKDGQGSFFVEILGADRDRENAVEPVLAIGGLIAMPSSIPGEDADLVEIERLAVVRLGQHA